MSFSPSAAEGLRALINDAVHPKDGPKIAGTAAMAIDRSGQALFSHAAGALGLASPEHESVDLDTVFWIASCTKLITGIACMQLVETGVLELDDAEQLEGLCPELKALVVLKRNGQPGSEPKKNGITLRMLLTHTAGFSYSFFNERLRDWSGPAGIDEFSGSFKRDMMQPLMFQPGEGWEYGIGIDWAGVALERATGMKLNDYIQQHICEPLRLTSTNMIPTPAMHKKLAYMHQRLPDGTLLPRNHPMRNILLAETKVELEGLFHSGGAGMFSTPREYCRILSLLLNDGTCPQTHHQLLQPSTITLMFTNQIPLFPDFGQQGIPAAKPDLTNPIPALFPIYEPAPEQGWGLTFMLAGGPSGRSPGTAHWVGLSNCFWWCDREKGVAGVVLAQVLPFLDEVVLRVKEGVEEGIYRGLKEEEN